MDGVATHRALGCCHRQCRCAATVGSRLRVAALRGTHRTAGTPSGGCVAWLRTSLPLLVEMLSVGICPARTSVLRWDGGTVNSVVPRKWMPRVNPGHRGILPG